MFELEKKCIKEKLFEKPDLDLKRYYKRKLDGLNKLILDYLSMDLHYMTSKAMLLPVYLGSMHVCHAIRLLKSLLKEVMLDPVNLPYDKYAEEFEKIKSLFEQSYYDGQPIYIDDSDWDCFDFQMAFGVEEDSLFPSYPINEWELDKKIESCKSKASLQDFFDISLNNNKYLVAGIKFNLNELYCELLDIDDMMGSRLDEPHLLEELFKNRINDYMLCPRWTDARDELYNDIRLLITGNDEKHVLNNIKVQYYFRLKSNRIGNLFLLSKRIEHFVFDLDDPSERSTQKELNDFFKLYCQHELICKLVDYHEKWSVPDKKNPLFINKGTEYIVNALVPYLSKKVYNKCDNQTYAALYRALMDLGLSYDRKSKYFMEWVNGTFLKDGHASTANGKANTPKSITQPFESLYGREFKDLTIEEISENSNLEKMKPFYLKSVWILSKAFGIDLKERGFQTWITEWVEAEEFTRDFQNDAGSTRILECFRAYEAFLEYQSSGK